MRICINKEEALDLIDQPGVGLKILGQREIEVSYKIDLVLFKKEVLGLKLKIVSVGSESFTCTYENGLTANIVKIIHSLLDERYSKIVTFGEENTLKVNLRDYLPSKFDLEDIYFNPGAQEIIVDLDV